MFSHSGHILLSNDGAPPVFNNFDTGEVLREREVQKEKSTLRQQIRPHGLLYPPVNEFLHENGIAPAIKRSQKRKEKEEAG